MTPKGSPKKVTKLFEDAQSELFETSVEAEAHREVSCLGTTFESEDERREHFRAQLKERLEDTEFTASPGFPIGAPEDILELSDPPFFTACPNPFISELIAQHRSGDGAEELPQHSARPYTEDVAASKADVVYTAHSYHTKVPPQAIATYIRHFTEPGAVVLDFFAGSGMTAVACKLADAQDRLELGRDVCPRLPICVDLSPAATFIESVYSSPPDPNGFSRLAKELVHTIEVETEEHYRHGLEGLGDDDVVEYILWNELLHCPSCGGEVVSTEVVNPTKDSGAADVFPCPACGARVGKAPTKASGGSRLARHLVSSFDRTLGQSVKVMNRLPIAAQVRDRTIKKLADARRLIPIEGDARRSVAEPLSFPSAPFPTDPLIEGERYKLKDCLPSYGITHVHHFYLPRQLAVYSRMWELANARPSWKERQALRFLVQSNGLGYTVMNRYQPTQFGKKTGGSQVNRYFSGTLYVPSMVAEVSPGYAYSNKLKRLGSAFKALKGLGDQRAVISTQSATSLSNIPSDSVDYVFVDPPFGRNLQYSELSQIWESWLRVKTNRNLEAVVDSTRERGVGEYTALMASAFAESFRVLRPGGWITVEFHNSSNGIWHAIQEALFSAGFVVADVRTLSKMQETYKQSRQGLMKQDLVISAYRPSSEAESAARLTDVDTDHVWTFVRQHLGRLPVATKQGGTLEQIAERQPRLLYDRMVAFYVQRGARVPMSAPEFYAGLDQRFPMRDESVFLSDQLAEYERLRLQSDQVGQIELFVNDEASAIQWLRIQLGRKPRTAKDMHTDFMKQVSSWAKHEEGIELAKLLEENFLCFSGEGAVPNQIHAYLSSNYKDLRGLAKDDARLRAKASNRWYVPDPKKEGDLELLRLKGLLSEFESYRTSTKKRIKLFRTEAVRAGFKSCYDVKDYATIVTVAQKLPEDVVQEDEQLLMYYDVAAMRLGE